MFACRYSYFVRIRFGTDWTKHIFFISSAETNLLLIRKILFNGTCTAYTFTVVRIPYYAAKDCAYQALSRYLVFYVQQCSPCRSIIVELFVCSVYTVSQHCSQAPIIFYSFSMLLDALLCYYTIRNGFFDHGRQIRTMWAQAECV